MLLTAVAIRFDSHGLGLSDQQERRHGNASTSNPQRSRPPVSSRAITFLGVYSPSRWSSTRGLRTIVWIDIDIIAQPSSSSIGGLVVKLAVAIRDLISYDSASPGFDSRPMHECAIRPTGVSFLLLARYPSRDCSVCAWESARPRRVGGVEVMWLPWSVGGGEAVKDCHVKWYWK